jgi:hypothetical protein
LADDVDPGDHRVTGDLLGKGEGAGEKLELAVIEPTGLTRRSDHQFELFNRTHPCQFLPRLDSEACDRPVCRTVEEENQRS